MPRRGRRGRGDSKPRGCVSEARPAAAVANTKERSRTAGRKWAIYMGIGCFAGCRDRQAVYGPRGRGIVVGGGAGGGRALAIYFRRRPAGGAADGAAAGGCSRGRWPGPGPAIPPWAEPVRAGRGWRGR